MRFAVLIPLALSLVLAGEPSEAAAKEITRTYEFSVDDWKPLDVEEGPVILHRVRLDNKEGRLTQAALSRRHNQEYLQPIRFHLEYSNSSTAKRRVRVAIRWLDDEGRAIDGFTVAETLQKQSSHRVVQDSVATLQYGLERAATLEVEIRFEP